MNTFGSRGEKTAGQVYLSLIEELCWIFPGCAALFRVPFHKRPHNINAACAVERRVDCTFSRTLRRHDKPSNP